MTSAPLQSKLQLLAVLAVAFILLAAPLFYQVRADASESRETAKSTLLSKMFRDLAKSLKAKPPEDLQVEDAWRKWQEQNPDCGPECDPEADPDGDGMTNREEVSAGRNPYCNEETEGREYCAGQPNTPPPTPNSTAALNDLLYEVENAPAGHSANFRVAEVRPNYDRWRIEWTLTGYSGLGSYSIALRDEDGNRLCCPPRNIGIFQSSDSQTIVLDGESVPPSGFTYSISVEAGSFDSGAWTIRVYGQRDARGAS